MEKKYLGLIVRCCGEYWMEEFCSYYLSQGVDEIHILNDGAPNKFYANLRKNERVHIKHVKNTFVRPKHGPEPPRGSPGGLIRSQMKHVNRRYKKIRGRFEWMIVCDTDEFITTRKNVNRTIREELKETFAPNNVDIILVPWVMMSCGGRKKSPESILNGITMRWDHDKRHSPKDKTVPPHNKFKCYYKSIDGKSVFRTSACSKMVGPHHPRYTSYKKHVNSINLEKIPKAKDHGPQPYLTYIEEERFRYKNLREEDIKNGYLLCYHYRTISVEYSEHKVKNSQLYRTKKVKSKQIMNFDFPEIRDETLKHKIKNCGDLIS